MAANRQKRDQEQESDILFIDNECVLCSRLAQFIAKRDPSGKIRFAGLQSEGSERILLKHGYTNAMQTVVLLRRGTLYTKSSAALQTVRTLNRLWPLLYGFIIIPRPIRDWLYDAVAVRRYAWFGRKDACGLPSPELRQRFIEF